MIEVNNLTDVRIEADYFKKIAEAVFRLEKKNKSDLSVAFIKPLEIKKLNKKYRKKNKSTDVLSFLYDNSGEIVICPQVVRNNAKKFNSSFKKELTKVLIHGILHIFGYDHEKSQWAAKIMDKKQNYYLEKLS